MKSHTKYSYYVGYVTIKEYVKIHSVNLLYLAFRYVNGCFEKINGNKLTLVPTNELKDKKCEKKL